ncbi:hypothetical protein ACPA9J_18315 [Pseudomonas aeruginosa]
MTTRPDRRQPAELSISTPTNARDAMPNCGPSSFPRATSGAGIQSPSPLHRATISAWSIKRHRQRHVTRKPLRRAVETLHTLTKGIERAPGWACRSSTASPSWYSAAGLTWRASRASAPPRTSRYLANPANPGKRLVRAMALMPQAPSESERVRLSCRVRWWMTTRW